MPVTGPLLLGLVLGALANLRPRSVPLAFFLTWPGVLAHELAHWLVAWLTGSKPRRLRLLPVRSGEGSWTLGSVEFTPGWLTAGWVALAPAFLLPPAALGLLAGAAAMPLWRQVGAGYAASVFIAAAVPSMTDIRLAFRYPVGTLLLLGGTVAGLCRQFPILP